MTKPVQTELFEGGTRRVVKRRRWKREEAADARRILTKYCWSDCLYCAPEQREQTHKDPRYRLYRLCMRPTRQVEERCFEHSVVCEFFLGAYRTAPTQSRSTGWEDY